MTDHDSALHKGIAESRPSTPAEVRGVVSRLALSGALGPEAKEREVERAQADRTRVADLEFVLILHMLSSCGADIAILTSDPGLRGTAEAKALVAAAAAVAGVRRQDIYKRISDLAQLLAPIGLPAILPGWLRVEHAEIEVFGGDCLRRSEGSPPEIEQALAACAQSANRTTQLSGRVLGMIDYELLDIVPTIKHWNMRRAVVGQVIDRLSLLLDEWPALMTAVRDALRDPQGDRITRLRVLSATLPQSPEMSASEQPQMGQGSEPVSHVLAKQLSQIWSTHSLPRPTGASST